MTTIKIAPRPDEINVNGSVVSTTFNGLKIEFHMIGELDEEGETNIKKMMSQAIALSSRPHHLAYILDGIKTTDGKQLGTCIVMDAETNEIITNN